MSVNAYKKTIREVESPRQIERRVLSTINSRMAEYAAQFDGAARKEERLSILSEHLQDILTENQKFWSVLKHDLASPENQLPADLRASLLSLALWIDRQTAQVLGGATGVSAIVTVNTCIVAALRGAPRAAA